MSVELYKVIYVILMIGGAFSFSVGIVTSVHDGYTPFGYVRSIFIKIAWCAISVFAMIAGTYGVILINRGS